MRLGRSARHRGIEQHQQRTAPPSDALACTKASTSFFCTSQVLTLALSTGSRPASRDPCHARPARSAGHAWSPRAGRRPSSPAPRRGACHAGRSAPGSPTCRDAAGAPLPARCRGGERKAPRRCRARTPRRTRRRSLRAAPTARRGHAARAAAGGERAPPRRASRLQAVSQGLDGPHAVGEQLPLASRLLVEHAPPRCALGRFARTVAQGLADGSEIGQAARRQLFFGGGHNSPRSANDTHLVGAHHHVVEHAHFHQRRARPSSCG